MGKKFKLRLLKAQPDQCPPPKTAFRAVERKYKKRRHELNMDEVFDASKRTETSTVPNLDPDLVRNWLDLRHPTNAPEGRMPDSVLVCSDSVSLAYVFPSVPGLVFIPNAVPPKKQQILAYRSLTQYTRPPNRSNLSAHWAIPECGVWHLYVTGDTPIPLRTDPDPSLTPSIDLVPERPLDLLHRIRWVTLGNPYNWIDQQYDQQTTHDPLPADLVDITNDIIRATSDLYLPEKLTQRPLWHTIRTLNFGTRFNVRDWAPQAGVLNIYGERDSLMAHVDNSEHNFSAPLISISLGAPAIFLIGGPTRDIRPIAILVRSGDVVVMSGPARLAFHGIPRVLDSELPKWICNETCLSCPDMPGWELVRSYMQSRRARFNLNVRQVI